MQQLTQLPKANSVFKEYVNSHIQHLIGQSQDLADKYMKEKEELITKSRQSQTSSIKQIKKKVQLLQILIKTPFQYRQNIEDVRGLTTEDIEEIKKEYEGMIQKYKIEQIEDDKTVNLSEKNMENNLDLSVESKDQFDTYAINQTIRNKYQQKKIIYRYCLQILEATTVLVVGAAFIWKIFM